MAAPQNWDRYDVEAGHASLEVLVDPNDDLGGEVRAWDLEEERFIRLNGWMCEWERAEENA